MYQHNLASFSNNSIATSAKNFLVQKSGIRKFPSKIIEKNTVGKVVVSEYVKLKNYETIKTSNDVVLYRNKVNDQDSCTPE